MSNSEKEAAFYLTLIGKIGESFLKNETVTEFAARLAVLHNVTGEYTRNDEKYLNEQFKKTEIFLEKLSLNVSQIFLFFLVKFVCGKFISLPISQMKKEEWKELDKYCYKQLPKNHLLFDEEKEKAMEVFEFMEFEVMRKAA